MASRRKSKKEQSFASGVCIGILVSLLLSIILSMIAATFVLNERIGESAIDLMSWIIMLISSMSGCFVAIRLIGEKLAVVSAATGLIYFLIAAGMGILFFNGGFHNVWTSILSIAAGSVASCAICIRGKGSRRKRKRANC